MPEMMRAKVSVYKGCVFIEQEQEGETYASSVCLCPEQIPLVIEWLKAAALEAEAQWKGPHV